MSAEIVIGSAKCEVPDRTGITGDTDLQSKIRSAIQSGTRILCSCSSARPRLVAVRVDPKATDPAYWLRRYRVSDPHDSSCQFCISEVTELLPLRALLPQPKRVDIPRRRKRPNFPSQRPVPHKNDSTFESFVHRLFAAANREAWLTAQTDKAQPVQPIEVHFCAGVQRALEQLRFTNEQTAVQVAEHAGLSFVVGITDFDPELATDGPFAELLVASISAGPLQPVGRVVVIAGRTSLLAGLPSQQDAGTRSFKQGPYFTVAVVDRNQRALQLRLLPAYATLGTVGPVGSNVERDFVEYLTRLPLLGAENNYFSGQRRCK